VRKVRDALTEQAKQRAAQVAPMAAKPPAPTAAAGSVPGPP
jgi:hypothetical protein